MSKSGIEWIELTPDEAAGVEAIRRHDRAHDLSAITEWLNEIVKRTFALSNGVLDDASVRVSTDGDEVRISGEVWNVKGKT